jgi:sirohydrochlorin ferrochelatase
MDVVVDQLTGAHRHVKFAISRPIGPEGRLLPIIDRQLRQALQTAQARELDGLVLSTAGPADQCGAERLARLARPWGAHHRLPCQTAIATEAEAGVVAAINQLRAQGRRHIAVGSFFLAGDHLFDVQAHQAIRHGAVAVANPIQAADPVLDIIMSRYFFAAMDLLDLGFEPNETDQQPAPEPLTYSLD